MTFSFTNNSTNAIDFCGSELIGDGYNTLVADGKKNKNLSKRKNIKNLAKFKKSDFTMTKIIKKCYQNMFFLY